MVLNKINEPKDLKSLSKDELSSLANEIREILIRKVSTTGGHFGPNLGMVEATIAMHYVFNSPIDKIVYDVSHQSYTHKILTGRKNAFINPDEYEKILSCLGKGGAVIITIVEERCPRKVYPEVFVSNNNKLKRVEL